MSGELLRVRIVLGFSTVTVVRRRGTPSSASTSSSHSPSTTRCWRLKRAGVGLRVAPRPRFDSIGTARVYAPVRTYQEHLLFRNVTGAIRHVEQLFGATAKLVRDILLVPE